MHRPLLCGQRGAPSVGAQVQSWSGSYTPHATAKDPACHNQDEVQQNKTRLRCPLATVTPFEIC